MRQKGPVMVITNVSQETTTIEKALNAARERIQVTREELDEARRRRGLLEATLEREFGGRTYVNGSIAHGDALNPLTDVDLGIVIPDPDGQYGPNGEGPARFQDRAARAIRRDLGDEFPNLRVEHLARRRSVLVKFGDPVTVGQEDFTSDVITAIDNPDGEGLYIPDFDGWDRSHPERHTAMVRDANRLSEATFARGVRLMKHWNRRHDFPVCSWNIKALALEWTSGPMTMAAFIDTWLHHAVNELSTQDTPDPAGVAAPIQTNRDRRDVVGELDEARLQFGRALQYERDGDDLLALNELAVFFEDDDMMPWPDQAAVREAMTAREVRLFRGNALKRSEASTTPIAARIDTRSWSC